MIEKINIFLEKIYNKHNIAKDIKQLVNSDWRNENYTKEQKEVINSTTNFFYFILDEENWFKLEEIYSIIKKNEDRFRIEFKEEKSFYLTLIIFKSFLFYSPVFITNFGDYKNSDKLLDFSVEMYNSYSIFYNINFKEKKTIRGQFHLCFHLLIKSQAIDETKIKIDRFLNKFWKINLKKKNECDYEFKMSYLPFSIKKKNSDTFLVGLFFWNVYDIYTKNFYSNTKFNITKEEYLDLLVKRHLHIDIGHFKLIKDNLEENEDDLEILNKELIEKISMTNWNINSKIEIELLQKKYSKKIESIILLNFLKIKFNENDKIYFPFYFDFRGRKYYNSSVGPTQNKVLRTVYHYGWYDRDDFSNLIKIEKILEYKTEILNFCKKNKLDYDDCFLESYFWCLIGIGKFGINKAEIEIYTTKIFNEGVKIFEDKLFQKLNLELDEKIEILHYFEIINSLKIKDIDKIKKRIIIKDGTASVYQISMLLLNPKSQDCLKWVNLFNYDSWVDTYSYIIQKFKENYKDLDQNFLELINRKSAKKILMTIPYSIGLSSAYKYFIEYLNEKKINYSDVLSIKSNFNKFYNFVKKDFEKKYLYKDSSEFYTEKIMQDYLKERSIMIKTETGETDLSYNKMKRNTIDLIFEMRINEEVLKERITKLIRVPSKSIDVRQTNISLGANLRHFYEADLLRITEIYLNYSINSVHDAELIDFNSCSKLILIKNRIFKDLFLEYKIWSIFIII